MDLKQRIDQYFDDNREKMVQDIARLVAIRSVRGDEKPGMPFGEGPAQALACAEQMAQQMGLSVKNFENYVTTINLNEKPTQLGILCHLDVVHEGTGWSTDPFQLHQAEGKVFGRGVSDDKGPAVTALYALKAAKDLALPLKHNVRLILGADEECGSSDLVYYFQQEAPPPNTFSPDAAYPVYNVEKGSLRTSFTASYPAGSGAHVVWAKGGTTLNIVPQQAQALVAGVTPAQLEQACRRAEGDTALTFVCTQQADGVLVEVQGTPSHASTPEGGNNAVTGLLHLLTSLPLDGDPCHALIRNASALFPHGDWAGKAVGVAQQDALSGPLTCSLDILKVEQGKFEAFFDIRSPICANEQNTSQVIGKRMAENGFTLTTDKMDPPHHVPEDSPFIQVLLKTYEQYTGKRGECLSMGGGTYVHHIEGGVAFGPSFPGTATGIHGANECAVIEELLLGAKMFTQIIADICG